MAKKKLARSYVRLRSTESHHIYMTSKSRRNTPGKLELKKYDPVVRKHVMYRETK